MEKTYTLTLNNGQQYDITSTDFDMNSFLLSVNDHRIFVIAVGELAFARQLFGTIAPKGATPVAQNQ
jgi:hypothetical protein